MSPKKKIFVSRLVEGPEKGETVIKILKHHFTVRVGQGELNEEECAKKMQDVDGAIVTMDCPVTRRVMESAPRLKVVSKHGVGLENIDVDGATDLGVIVAYTPVNFVSVAEGTILLMLGTLRKITRATNYVRNGEWKTVAVGKELLGKELFGKTVGILGLGRIGFHLSKMLKCFGVQILAYDPYVSPEKAAQVEARLVPMKTLLEESDIVTVHIPLSAETRHLIGKRELREMKHTSIIINTSRGAVIDEKALVVALENGWIAAAGLDVVEQEPPEIDNPLFKFDNVFATPHYLGSTEESRRKSVFQAAHSVVEVLQGRLPPLEFIANPKVLERLRGQFS